MLSRVLIGRGMRAINVLMACVSMAFIMLLVKLWIEPLPSRIEPGLLGTDEKTAGSPTPHDGNGVGLHPSIPPQAEYHIVVDRDPFRNQQEAPTSVPVRPTPASVPVVPRIPKAPIPQPPLPPLSVTLSGTIAIGEDRKAILKDGNHEDLYVLGQSVAGGVLEAIEADRVVIARGNTRTELLMKSAVERVIAPSMVAGGFEGQKSGQQTQPSERVTSLSQEKRKKIIPSNKFMFSTPAFARYPGGNQGSGRR